MNAPRPIRKQAPRRPTMGKVLVRVESDSWFLRDQIPVEVRDSQLTLTDRVFNRHEVDLPEGVYRFSAVLEDGIEHFAYQTVEVGRKSEVVLRAKNSKSEDKRDVARSRRFVKARENLRPSRAGIGRSFNPDHNESVQLLKLEGAAPSEDSEYGWAFSGALPSTRSTRALSVPSIRLRILKTTYTISLPVTPVAVPTPNTCFIHFEEPAPRATRVSTWFSRERIVASALQRMYMRGELSYASAIMTRNAAELLRKKYTDPPAAALGALVLNKVGRAHEFESWLINLARDFDWLPDGKILLAALWAQRKEDSRRALRLAREACDQTPLFTESFSLLLHLMRQWADKKSPSRASVEGLSLLTPKASRVDWNSFMFTLRETT